MPALAHPQTHFFGGELHLGLAPFEAKSSPRLGPRQAVSISCCSFEARTKNYKCVNKGTLAVIAHMQGRRGITLLQTLNTSTNLQGTSEISVDTHLTKTRSTGIVDSESTSSGELAWFLRKSKTGCSHMNYYHCV